MTPDDSAPPEDASTPPVDGGEPTGTPEEPGPPPATYAGRRRQEPPTDGDGDGAGDAPEPSLEDEIDAALPPAPEPVPAPSPEPVPAPSPEAGKTIEADTLALADREEAQEQAHAGLRARTEAHATKTEQRVAAATAGAAAAQPASPPKPAEPPAAKAAPASKPPPAEPPTPPPGIVGDAPKRRTWARYLAASAVIIMSIATATAVSGIVFAANIASGLEGLPSVENLLQVSSPEGPQTFLILGSDKRPGETDHGRSDTTILLRLTSSQINMLSIPRDLRVNIPGHGVNKLNAAYTYGGPRLTTRVVKQLTGLPINHVVNIDFTGFADAVNSIGCVYYDVDHHYFHSNVGLPALEQYAAINIHAGYQRMCGYNALQFVRYRHDDNDLIRSARQQAFLREARAQVPATQLLSDYQGLTNIFTKYTTSDIHDTATVIGLMKLLLTARNAQFRQIHFPAILGAPTDPYVTAHSTAIHAAVREFLGESNSAPSGTLGPGTGGSTNSGRTPGSGQSGSSKKSGSSAKTKKGSSSSSAPAVPPAPAFTDVTSTAQQYATKLANERHGRWRRQGKVPMLYPTKIVPGSELVPDSNAYPIDGPGSQVYDGYTFVAEIPAGTAGYGYSAYYDFTGTNWPDPPILDSPTATKTINGEQYLMFWDGGRLRQVGWKTSKGSYWVNNDLLETLTPGQMVGMAEAFRNSKG